MPWLEFDLALVVLIARGVVDGDVEGVVHEVLAPDHGHIVAEACDLGLVDAGGGAMALLGARGIFCWFLLR